VKRVSDARGIDSAQLQRYASDLALRSARNTVDLKMVDSLVYASDVERMLCEMTDRDEEPEFVTLSTTAFTWSSVRTRATISAL